jgi:hypothetical protein
VISVLEYPPAANWNNYHMKTLSIIAICALSFFQSPQHTYADTLSNGLIAHYPFNGTANDVSGNDRHMSVFNATLTTGSKGQSNGGYYFNGTNSYLSFSNFPVLTNNSFTWSIWIKPEYLPATNQNIAIMNLRSGVGLSNRSPYLALISHAEFLGDREAPRATFWSYSPNRAPTDTYPNFSQIFTSAGTINADTWQHLIITSDSNNIRRLYLNGRLESSRASSGYGDQYGTLLIGADIRNTTNNSGLFFRGSISSIRVYNRPLSDAEVTAVNLLERPVYEVSLTLKSSTNLNEWTSVLTNKIETYNPNEFYKTDISVTIKPPAQ